MKRPFVQGKKPPVDLYGDDLFRPRAKSARERAESRTDLEDEILRKKLRAVRDLLHDVFVAQEILAEFFQRGKPALREQARDLTRGEDEILRKKLRAVRDLLHDVFVAQEILAEFFQRGKPALREQARDLTRGCYVHRTSSLQAAEMLRLRSGS